MLKKLLSSSVDQLCRFKRLLKSRFMVRPDLIDSRIKRTGMAIMLRSVATDKMSLLRLGLAENRWSSQAVVTKMMAGMPAMGWVKQAATARTPAGMNEELKVSMMALAART